MTVQTQYHLFALDGFPLTGYDDLGALWTVEKVSGWFTGGDVRQAAVARAQQSGDWRGTAYRAGRVITLQGKVMCPTTEVLEVEARRLSAILADGGFGQLVGDSPFGTLTSQVQTEQTPMFDPYSDVSAVWQVTVASESPLLFGPEAFGSTNLAASAGGTGLTYPLTYPLDYGVPPGVTPGAITLPNAGTAGYFPRLRIDGPVPNPTVTLAETGESIRYNGTVAAGQWLDIDCGRRRVLLNGLISHRFRVNYTGGWLGIPVGGGSLTWTADAADPAATLSAWGHEGAWS